jgi:CheY-like chemotaxis protein/CHASE3 domain sensor protein
MSGIFIYIIFHLLSVNDWVNHSNKVMANAYELLQMDVDAIAGVRGYLITGDEEYLSQYKKMLLKTDEKYTELANQTADSPAQSNLIREIEKNLKLWDEVYASKVIKLKMANKDYEKILPSLEGKKIMDAVRSGFTQFIAVEEDLKLKRIETSKQTITFTLTIIMVGGILAGLFIAYYTRKQLKELSSSYSDIISKQQELANFLEIQEWIQSGKSGIMDQIRGDHTSEELAEKILQYLCSRIDGKIAAFYNVENNSLRRIATYAFSSKDSKEVSIVKFGDGLVGQTAIEKNIRVLENLPEGYLNIKSSTGSTKAQSVILLPLLTDGQLKGVIEIGFLSEIKSNVVEFLQTVAESLAISLKSSEYRVMLGSLLEESQRQTEELQTQQEELQANNEELEEQTNALKESQINLETQQAELEQTNEQLSKQSLELERQSDAVRIQNEELEKSQRNLEKKALELEQASQYKSQFLANMSHELRTPLNSSLILSQLLLEDKRKVLGPEEREFVQTILSSSNDLLTLINDILDLSKVEAGKIELEPGNIILSDFILSMERLFKPVAKNKGIDFVVELDINSPMTVFLDRQRVEQILKNLISNAIKFTERGCVTLRIIRQKENKQRIEFQVIDTGIGIEAEQLELIFDAFRQADGGTSRKYGGTGLGLTISKDLARLMAGDILVSSIINKGSTFTLNLPETHSASTEQTSVPQEKIEVFNAIRALKVEPMVVIVPPLPFEDDRHKIDKGVKLLLVVEDDSNFSKILYDLGHELQYQCIVAQTADEGIKAAEEFLPQAIILDMNLPDRSGLVVIDHLKMNPKTRHIPIHIVSAQDQANIALQMGAIGYLRKPVSLVDIRSAIGKMEEKFESNIRRVLVVEDNKVQRESIKLLIQDETVEVVMAENADMAIEFLKSGDYDCMILDLHLPDMNGYELLEKMTAIEGISHPPVIIYTGKDLSKAEEQKLQKYSHSIIIKGAHSPERLLSEVTLFLHQVENQLPKERQSMLQQLRDREQLFEGKKILLVDDDVRNIFALSAALESKGAILETARNGKEAVEKVRNIPGIDLVLMDIMMPEMDGYEATREIRKDPKFKRLPIIAVTAKAMSDDQERCREAGANDYLAKPVDLNKLLSLLRVWMPSHRRL